MRIVLLTSDQRRHRYAARALARALDVVGIVSEPKPASVPPPAVALDVSADDLEIVRRHFEERDLVEARLLVGSGLPEVERLSLSGGEINGERVLRWIGSRRPDLLVLYGTRIVEDPLLSTFPERIVNLHLGLSPYYRGSGTNFWPLVHRQPECVGVTIHLAVRQVDAGPILAQLRPRAEPSDRCHELGSKALIQGVEALPEVLRFYWEGRIRPVLQDSGGGRLFRNRDFHSGAVREMWGHFATGMMPEYLADAQRRRTAFPIVEVPAA